MEIYQRGKLKNTKTNPTPHQTEANADTLFAQCVDIFNPLLGFSANMLLLFTCVSFQDVELPFFYFTTSFQEARDCYAFYLPSPFRVKSTVYEL